MLLLHRGANGRQYEYCLDSTGADYLQKDTAGLCDPARGYTEYKHFFETSRGEVWIFGFNLLLNYDKNRKRFYYNKSSTENENSIDYESVFQVFEDKDGNLWLATNQGIYFTSTGSANSSVVNLTFNKKNGPTAINDILEMPDESLWFASWETGVTTTDKCIHKTGNDVFRQLPPAQWTKK